jgi:hypothetical protein
MVVYIGVPAATVEHFQSAVVMTCVLYVSRRMTVKTITMPMKFAVGRITS